MDKDEAALRAEEDALQDMMQVCVSRILFFHVLYKKGCMKARVINICVKKSMFFIRTLTFDTDYV
jgi:hypothetical protein